MIFANRNEADAPVIRAELKEHLLDKADDLQANGLSTDQALSQAIEDHGAPKTIGYALRPRFKWLDVRTHGTARGIIAIGPKAVGVVAIGGIATGVFAYGVLSLGLLSCGLLGIGLLIALGGVAIAPFGAATGLIAIGLVAMGLVSVGIWATGWFIISGLMWEGATYCYSISQETWGTAPAYIQHIYKVLIPLCTIRNIFYESSIVLLIAKLFLSRKELNRIKKADPSLV